MSNEEKDLETPCPYHSQEKYGQCDNPETISTYCANNKHCFYKLYALKVEEQSNKCKKVLSEIKEIAEPIQKNTCFGMYCGAIDEILKIINEVEDEG